MNRITKLVNRIDKALDPLADLANDENFRGEALAAAGLKEKSSPQDKAKTKEKLNALLRVLDALRKKLGLDKSDIPNVSNIVALGLYLAECYAVTKALREVFESCDPIGAENEAPDKETAVLNAIKAFSRYLTQNIFRKEAPAIAAWGEAAGVFSDESNETKRALDLLLFPLFVLADKAAGIFDKSLNADFLRPVGDVKADDNFRITKGIFLALSVASVIIEEKIKTKGKFLFNFGYELPSDKDSFPLAANVAARVFQMQFLPEARYFTENDEWIGDEAFQSALRDSFISFVTIPVFAPDDGPESEPLGFQYLLNLELNPGTDNPTTEEPGLDKERLSLTFPVNFTGSAIWGHGTNFTLFKSDPLGSGPLLVARYTPNKPTDTTGSDYNNDVSGGDISFSLEPKKVQQNGQPKDDLELKLTFHEFGLAISGDGRDGFLQKILPDNAAAKLNASFAITYSALRDKWTVEGLDGNEGLLLLFSIKKSLFGILSIPTLYLGLKPFLDEEKKVNGVTLEASALMSLILGPFSLTVDRLGLHTTLRFPKTGEGNLGSADVDASLKPPTGIGFLVKASVIKGGGFLSIDRENNQYYGAGELTITFDAKSPNALEVSLKVVAIILTRLPDGSKGFSFLLLATVEFNPAFELPFGFKLKGVGVLVAIHRSMSLEAMQQAVRDDRFNSILFPDNPVANAPTIVKSMNSLFPPAQDRYVFALMARIGWGSSKLVDLKLGLMIEVPSPVKLALVGVLKITVDEAGIKILKFQVNFLIALDLGKKIFSIDAAIYDSKFLIFSIKGEMFLRYRWGADPVFLFAVGGWHPDFEVPSGLNLPQKPQRVTVPLLEDDNPSLILSCYVAFTSNTIQAGFAIDFKMKWSKFRLEAGLSVDALFHFDPFYFVVDFEGKLRIYWGDSRLAGVTVKGEFSGTNPWRIRGTATFEIWIWDYQVDFDKSTGEKLSSITQEVQVLPLLQKAVSDKTNWQTVLPAGRSTHVMLRNTEEDVKDASGEDDAAEIIADPLSRLDITQQVTPLAIRIDKLGFQKVNDFRKYDLVAVDANNQLLDGSDVEDFFAAGMFLELSDSEKLSRKSYELMKSGRSFSSGDRVTCGAARITPFEYENYFHDSLAPMEQPPPPPVQEKILLHWALNNSIARSPEGRKSIAKKEIEIRKTVIKSDPFVLADTITGNKVANVPGQKSMTGAYYELWKLQQVNPKRNIKVIRESELMN